MPPDRSNEPPTTIDHGRIRACGGLLVSVNRSWQVDVEPGQRPVAAFKAMAPIAPGPAAEEADDVHLAAVGAHDAFWLGFEADDAASYAVTIDVDGRNALTRRAGPTTELDLEPRNFLVVPDQPWFDSIVDADGAHRQLVPSYDAGADPASPASGARVVLGIHRIDTGSIAAPREPEGPVPQYADEVVDPGPERPPAEAHRWAARDVDAAIERAALCATVRFMIVEPSRYEALTGTTLPPDMFDDVESEPPAPFDPFQDP